jgi:hypothetical protein
MVGDQPLSARRRRAHRSRTMHRFCFSTARRDPSRCGRHAAPNRVTRASPPVGAAAAAPRDALAGGSPAQEVVPSRAPAGGTPVAGSAFLAPAREAVPLRAGGMPAAGSARHAPAQEALPPRVPVRDIAAPELEAPARAGKG